ncbi:hypothetical protein HN51_023478 [Arachis hypogaea]|uniref:uncharacterized protein LOC107608000 n=1 Tax=Arachis ipaensis TaxID=130454 RepID=UPI0007AF55D6|nr:uncharacterized protein LOC107608000 [Arachis ipaensis]XP_025668385.1 uncharacterized protein LOC112766704 [Arachis hypogaea]QHO26361.1 uncharacterized protein DS421_7g198910 [Arachis hypogaea]
MVGVNLTKNSYWVLRHGKSIPNEQGLIVSSMENGTRPEFQLATEGIEQAHVAAKLFQQELEANNIPLANVRICYSPFSRTKHTAQVVAAALNLPFEGPQCKMVEDLRERYFGPSFELLSHDKYAEIWKMDEKDPLVGQEGGESVKDVACRLTRAVTIMESEYEGCAILVVSHGDPLQILQTILLESIQQQEHPNKDLASILSAVQVASILSQHRKYALVTGELRRVV